MNPVNPVCSTSTPGPGQWREAADRWCSKSSGTPARRFHPAQGIQGIQRAQALHTKLVRLVDMCKQQNLLAQILCSQEVIQSSDLRKSSFSSASLRRPNLREIHHKKMERYGKKENDGVSLFEVRYHGHSRGVWKATIPHVFIGFFRVAPSHDTWSQGGEIAQVTSFSIPVLPLGFLGSNFVSHHDFSHWFFGTAINLPAMNIINWHILHHLHLDPFLRHPSPTCVGLPTNTGMASCLASDIETLNGW